MVKEDPAMNLPNAHFRPPPEREVPAIVRVIPREDVTWNRPVFKAPPLIVSVPSPDQLFADASVFLHPSAR
jgi:hypothetical protein